MQESRQEASVECRPTWNSLLRRATLHNAHTKEQQGYCRTDRPLCATRHFI